MVHFVAEKKFFNMHSATLLNKVSVALPFCIMFSSEESKVDANFQASLWSNTKLLHKTQQKTCVIDSQKIFDSPFQFSLKPLKNIYLRPDLPDWYIYLCTFCSKFSWSGHILDLYQKWLNRRGGIFRSIFQRSVLFLQKSVLSGQYLMLP